MYHILILLFIFFIFPMHSMDKWDYFSNDYKKEYKTSTTPMKKFEVRPYIHKWEEEKNKMNEKLFLEITKQRPKSPPHFYKKIKIDTDSYKNSLYKGEKTVGDCKQFLQSLKVKITSDEISPGTYHRLKNDINCLDNMLNTYGIEHLEAIQNNWMDTEKALIYYRQLCQRKDAHDSIKKAARDFIEKHINIRTYIHNKVKEVSQLDTVIHPLSESEYNLFIMSQKINTDHVMKDMHEWMEKNNIKQFDASQLSDTIDFLSDLNQQQKKDLYIFSNYLKKFIINSGKSCSQLSGGISTLLTSFIDRSYTNLSTNQTIMLGADILNLVWKCSVLSAPGVPVFEWDKEMRARYENELRESFKNIAHSIKHITVDNPNELLQFIGEIMADLFTKIDPVSTFKSTKRIGVISDNYLKMKNLGKSDE